MSRRLSKEMSSQSVDEDFDYTDSQSSQRRSSKKKNPNTTLVSDVVNFILGTAGNRKKHVKKEDICHIILKDFSKQFPEIFAAAKVKLENVFGLYVIEVSDHKNTFMVINKHSLVKEKSLVKSTDSEYAENGLLFIILTLIFMNGNLISEKHLFASLALLGIDTEQPHYAFGNVSKLITVEFVKRNYLKVTPIPNTEPVEHDLMWGTRAEVEVSKMDVLEAACKVNGVFKPDEYRSQYKDAQEQHQQRLEEGII